MRGLNCVTDSDQQTDIIIFKSLLTTFEVSMHHLLKQLGHGRKLVWALTQILAKSNQFKIVQISDTLCLIAYYE